MATVVNIHHAKTHLSKIVDEAAAGREVIIAKAGRKVARLVPLESKPRSKRLGGLKGRIRTTIFRPRSISTAAWPGSIA